MSDFLLEIRGVFKSFAGNKALDGVSLAVRRGEVVALLGHNGSGKSTLVKILSGNHTLDEGEVRRGSGGSTHLHFIHQNLALLPTLTVAENLDIGTARVGWGLGPIRRRDEERRLKAMLDAFGVPIDPNATIASLTPAKRTIVAIVRALNGWDDGDHVLVLDEPTAALHGEEVEILKGAVRTVTSRGAGIIYITHRLGEAVELADRAIVLKNGRVVADHVRGEFDHDDLVRIIAGNTSFHGSRRQRKVSPAAKLTVRDLHAPTLRGVSFTAQSGEILGIAGLVGSGMEQLNGAIFGGRLRYSGDVSIAGKRLDAKNPAASIRGGLAYIPADRRAQGGFGAFSARENITLPRLNDLRLPWGAIDHGREAEQTLQWMERLQVKPHGMIEQPFDLFSGGNQQKVVLAKWLRISPAVLLIDEPTQGVDAGSQAEIYRLLAHAADQGAVVIVSSSDAKELVALCDRVLVLRDGVVSGAFSDTEINESALVAAVLDDGISMRTVGAGQHSN